MDLTKEQKIQDRKIIQLINELSKMPPIVIETAYLYALNYTLYGGDVTEKWVTATQNAHALEKAYRDGYYNGLQKLFKHTSRSSFDNQEIDDLKADIAKDLKCGRETENIELVIKIDKEIYNAIKRSEANPKRTLWQSESAIAKGTPLPKGHGRIIDEDQIPGDSSWDFSDRLMLTPTIIEAESEDKE